MSTYGASKATTVNDDDKAILADAAYQAAIKLLNDPVLAAKLPAPERASLKAAANKVWSDLAVYRGELMKQQRRRSGPPLAFATTQTMPGAGTNPFGALVAAAALAAAALVAIPMIVSSAQRARFSLDQSLTSLRDESNSAISVVPRPLPVSPNIPKPFFDELIRLGILIAEATIISIDFSNFRKKVVEIMKGIEDLRKQNKNDCDDLYKKVRDLALSIFGLLDRLPANDNDGGQAVIRATNEAVKWMKAVNDLFDCFNLPTPFPRVT